MDDKLLHKAKLSSFVKLLHKAIEYGDKQLIKTLIQNGVNLKARNDRGMNCLHLAVERSSWEIVNQLLEADKSLVKEVVVSSDQESDDDGFTALHISAKLKDNEIAIALFGSGAKGDVVDRNLRTPLHLAVLHENINGVEVLLCHSVSVNAEDCEGKTAFMYAVERDHVKIVKLMLRWADKEICKSYAKAIIEIASDSRCVEFVQSILDDNMCRMLYDEMLIEILKCAIEKKRMYVIDNLLSGVNISLSLDDSLENSKLIATVDSVNETNIKVAQFLMNYYNYIIKFVDLETALHFAVITNCNDLLNTYLKEGVNVDCKNVEGDSLLYMMCEMQNVDAAKKCIALGCDVNDKNYSGNTPLHAAVKTVNPELVVLLKESGWDLNAKNNYFETPFKLFLQNLNYFHVQNRNLSNDVIELKQNDVIVVAKALLKPEMDLSCHENSYECVLHLAVKTGIVELVKMVIKYHPSLDHFHKDNGSTCLNVAAELNYVDVVKFLLEVGAKPDVRDIDGELPLTIAIKKEYVEIVTLLVNYSNLNGYKGLVFNETVMHLAAIMSNKEIINAFVCAGVDLHAKDIYQRSPMCYVSAGKCKSIYQHLFNVGFDVNFGCLEHTCDCWSEFYTQDVTKIHVLKLHLIKYDLQPLLLSLIVNAVMEFKDVYFDISEEAKRLMTSLIPDTNIPFTDIIKLDDKKLANYARNEYVVRVFKDVDSLKMEWPHYSKILIARMTKGFVRRRLLDKCRMIFNSGVLVHGFFPYECVELILDNLETSELHTFMVSLTFVDTSQYDDLWFIFNE